MQKGLVNYHYQLLWAQTTTHISVELGVLKKLINTLTSMESCDLTAYLRDHLQITCSDYYSLQRFTVHGTKVIREHDIIEEVYLDEFLNIFEIV